MRPGKPVENAYAKSFNGRLQGESLSTTRFMSVGHASYYVTLATSANLPTHDSIPETLMPKGNKSRVSGDGLGLARYYQSPLASC